MHYDASGHLLPTGTSILDCLYYKKSLIIRQTKNCKCDWPANGEVGRKHMGPGRSASIRFQRTLEFHQGL